MKRHKKLYLIDKFIIYFCKKFKKMKANFLQNNFENTKYSINSKSKNSKKEFYKTNLIETLNIFEYNNKDNILNNKSSVNVKLNEKEEYEFPNIRVMQKELTKNIYEKETGEIINKIIKLNENLKVPNVNINNNKNYAEFQTKMNKTLNGSGNERIIFINITIDIYI